MYIKGVFNFLFHKHQRRFITAHAFVRIILAKYLNVNATQLTFTYNAHGKPALSSHPFLQFNSSWGEGTGMVGTIVLLVSSLVGRLSPNFVGEGVVGG